MVRSGTEILRAIRTSIKRLWTQLNSGAPTAGMDCGAITAINLIVWASHGKIGPDYLKPEDDPNSLKSWVRMVRQWAGNPNRPMLVEGDIFQVLNSKNLQTMFSRAGVGRMYATYHYGMAFNDLRSFLHQSQDHAAMLAIDYGVARANGAPMGSTSFSDGHAVALYGAEQIKVRNGRKYHLRWFTNVGDPLFDGRRKPRSLTRYPKGIQRARLFSYRRAAAAFGTGPDGKPRPIGPNRAITITVERGN